jgi:hypothetical protein
MLVGRALCGFGKGVSSPGITVSKRQRKRNDIVKYEDKRH